MIMTKKLLTILSLGGFAFAVTACDVDQTEEGEMPEVQVEEGNMPEYDVETADVEADMEEEEVLTPEVGLEEETIQVPDVDVEMPDEGAEDEAGQEDETQNP